MVADFEFPLREPLAVTGRLMESGPGCYYWKAQLVTAIEVVCRRCLESAVAPVRADVEALFTTDASADDPSMYALLPDSQECDLRPAVREELLLAVPEFPLCREGCRGICAQCGQHLNEGPCSCEPEPDPRWAALKALGNCEGTS